jgi:primary-amine oxidase
MADSIRGRQASIAAMAALAAVLTGAVPAGAAAGHPLDPLGADELATIGAVLKRSGQFSANTNFSWVQLQEPDKRLVQDFKPGADVPRVASLDAIDYDRRKAFAVVVDVKAQRIVSATELHGLQPGLTDRDTELADTIIDADPRVKAALVARGLEVSKKVSESVRIQFAPVGHDPGLESERGRLVRAFFGSDQTAVNEFSPFLDGLMAVVDLYAGQVIRLTDAAGVPEVHVPHDIFDPKVRGTPPRPSRVPAVRGGRPTFAVNRNVVSWQSWQFRYGFNPREGLVLYQVGYDDQGRRRPILYRASVDEIVTAYGDASDFWSWLELFDEGVFGLGDSAVEVAPGRQVPASAVTLDAVMPDAAQPRFSTRRRARIYVYERDGGSLLHYEQGDLTFHAHATELVIGSIASFGNYVYGLNWVFRQDGSFAFEAELAGEVLTKFVAQGACEVCKAAAAGPGPNGESRTYTSSGDDRYGTLVQPNLVAANHQHWFNLRLDFDIDGTANAVMENNIAHASGEHGEHREGGRGFSASHTIFGRSADAKRDMNDESARTWTVYNPSAVNREGRPAGYTIAPMANAMTIFPPARQDGAAGFTFHHLWVTPYRPGELYAGGPYPNQARRDSTDNLFHYADRDPVYDRDIVLWYSLGMTHFPRPEDYPIMSTDRISVVFRPDGFFARNRALGLGEVDSR